MTHVVVNDASCLIDLRKGGLLAAFAALPFQIVVPLPVRASEVLDFTRAHWRSLDGAGMITYDLSPDEVGAALALKARHPALSANDCFCYVTAEVLSGILLTGDRLLRTVATDAGLPVHGVLWIVDQLHAAQLCAATVLTRALRAWQADPTVFLPGEEILLRLEALSHRGLHP